jgi:hypothetical protein
MSTASLMAMLISKHLDETETITDTFTIQVSDGSGGTAEKTLEIEIRAPMMLQFLMARLPVRTPLKRVKTTLAW